MELTTPTSLSTPLPVAGVARRAGAAAIDLAVIVGGELFSFIALGVVLEAIGTTSTDFATGNIGAAAAIARAVGQLALYLGPVAYLYITWHRGASIGQRAMRCSLRAADGVSPVTSSQVVLRLCGLWFSVVSAGVGLLWGLFRRDRRGWSDLLAGTAVVHHPRSLMPMYGWGATPGWPVVPPPVVPPVLPPALAPPMPPPLVPPSPPALTAPMPLALADDTPTEPERATLAPWTWTDVVPVIVLVLPLSFGVQWVIVTALRWLLSGVSLDTRRPIEALLSDVAAYAAIFGLVVLFVKVRRHAPLSALGLRRVSWRWIAAAIPFAFLAFVLEGVTGLLSRTLFPAAPSNQCVDIRSAYQGALWLALLGVAVVAPLVEEIVFRGMVFGWLQQRVPLAAAVIISAALFSLEHISFLEVTLFLPIFTAGVVLAILYHHAKSVWPTVIVHGTFNLIATLVLFNTVSC